MSERRLIDWLRRRIKLPPCVEVGPGDDAAVIRPAAGSRIVVTTDAFLAGTHFAADASAARIGHKVIAASVSDIAAMGCYPLASFVTLGLARSFGESFVLELGEAMIAAAEKYDAPIAGGDITSWTGPLSVTVTVVGETRGLDPVLRSGAKPGDRIFVTGALGGSLVGRHLDAPPRVREGIFLNAEIGVNAMMDISDGLIIDLERMMSESKKGAVIYLENLPIPNVLKREGKENFALSGGEDYQLLFAFNKDKLQDFNEMRKSGFHVSLIGKVTRGKGVKILRNGKEVKIGSKGYEHFGINL